MICAQGGIGVGSLCAQSEPDEVRLRIAWGGGAAQQWSGLLTLSQGQFEALELLGIEADEPGSIWIDGAQLHVAGRSPRSYDGVDVTVRAPRSARITCTLAGDNGPSRTVEFGVGDAVRQMTSSPLDDRQNRLVAQRAPGDALRIELERQSLVFSPGEPLRFSIVPRLLDLFPASKAQLRVELIDSASGRVLAVEEPAGPLDPAATASIPVEFFLPQEEGAYDVRVAVHARRLGLKQHSLERKLQVVVVSDVPPVASQVRGAFVQVAEIDPTNARGGIKLANRTVFEPLRKMSLGIGDTHPWQHPLGAMMQLGPLGREPDISWEAYTLSIDKPGTPHLLEIEFPSDVPQTLGISIVEPNAAGELVPIGLDSGVYSPDVAADAPPRLLRHRLVFWPRTSEPLVLLTNRRDGSRAVYGKLRILSGPVRLPRALDDEPTGRLLAAYLNRPLFNENFGAREALDQPSGRSLDDWQTFYEGATRLVQYLQYAGYNALLLGVLADGSTIYPSRLLSPTPRYDTGVFFSSGQDPLRKDALELLLRICDRSGVQVIPQLQFAAPLPALEALRRAGGAEAEGLEWIGPDGAAWLAHHEPERGLAPYYNTLNPRVQHAMLEVVDELVGRYGHHPSLGGLAIELSAEGYAQLPGAAWGFDDQTIARFESETGTRLPPAALGGGDRFARRAGLLLHDERAAWIGWRTAALADFYRRMASRLHAARPGAPLYLVPGEALSLASRGRELVPTLRRQDPDDALFEALDEIGLRPEAYRDPQVVLLRPQRYAPPRSLAAEVVDLQLAQADGWDEAARRSPTPAALFFHEPQRARLPSFDAKSPYRNSYTWLVTQALPAGELNCRRFAHGLARLDARALFDGGLLVPLGQEEALHDFVQVYRRLPAAEFTSLSEPSQPVTIRTHYTTKATYVYFVNDSPWPAELSLKVAGGAGASFTSLNPQQRLPRLETAGGASTWTLDLPPYAVSGAVFNSAAVRFSEPSVRLAHELAGRLELHIQDLADRAGALARPQVYEALTDPGFESLSPDEPLPVGGPWTLEADEGDAARLDARQPKEGRQALVLESRGGLVSLASAPFRAPDTGRLSVAVWVRVDDAQQPGQLRIVLEAADDQSLRRVQSFGQNTPQPLAGEWTLARLAVDDLPLERLGPLRIRFELTGPGEVWLDDVRLSHLDFTVKEQQELQLVIYSAYRKLQKRELADCQRLLEGYWPRFLAAHVPLTQQPAESSPPEPPRAGGDQAARPAPAENPRTSGVWDRVRRWLPKWY